MRRLGLTIFVLLLAFSASGCQVGSPPLAGTPVASAETPTSMVETSVEYVGLSLAEILQLRDKCFQEKPDSLCLPLPINPEQYKVGVILEQGGSLWNVLEVNLYEADSALVLGGAFKDLQWVDQSQLDRPVRNYWFRIPTGCNLIELSYVEHNLLVDEQDRVVFTLPDERGVMVIFFP